MVTKFAEQLTQKDYRLTKLIIDEATLVSHLNLLSLIMLYSELERIFLTGYVK